MREAIAKVMKDQPDGPDRDATMAFATAPKGNCQNQENCEVVRSPGFSRLQQGKFRLKAGLRTLGRRLCSSPVARTHSVDRRCETAMMGRARVRR